MRKTTITIKRPNGKIETVDMSDKFPSGISNPMFDQIQVATKAAGRGWCLSYDVTDIDDRTDAEKDHDAIIGEAMSHLQAAESANYSNPKNIVLARLALENAQAEWAAKYPQEAKASQIRAAQNEQANVDRIKNSAGYQAAIEGRD